MNDYSKGKIYLIKNINDETLIGVGSTIYDLNDRFKNYKYETKTVIGKYINKDFKNWYIELYKNYPCNSKNELEIEEGKIIKQISTINKNIAGRKLKEWYIDNKEVILDKKRQYYIDNKEVILNKKRQYYINNKDKERQYYIDNKDKKRQYYIDNKDKKRQYYIDNKEVILDKKRQYYINNKEVILDKKRQYYRLKNINN